MNMDFSDEYGTLTDEEFEEVRKLRQKQRIRSIRISYWIDLILISGATILILLGCCILILVLFKAITGG